jgi:hypothetical protein
MGLITFLITLSGAVFLVGVSGYMIYRLAPEPQARQAVLAEWPWFAKGFALPAVLWVLMNVGLSFQLQPFMPSVQKAQNAGTVWFPTFLGVVGSGFLLIASYWAAVTVGWLLYRVGRIVEGEAGCSSRAMGSRWCNDPSSDRCIRGPSPG